MLKRYTHLATLITLIHIIGLLGLFSVQYPPEDAVILGRYTMRYAFLLGGAILVTILWGVVTLWHGRISGRVAQLPRRLVVAMVAISPFVVWGLWQWDVNRSATWFMIGTVYSIVIYMLHHQASSDDERMHDMIATRGLRLMIAIVIVLALSFSLQSLSTLPRFSPQDEAAWADVSTMYYRQNAKIFHIFLDRYPDAFVPPGTGALIPVILGLPLHYIESSPYVGRILTVLAYLLSAYFVYRATRSLTNTRSGLISAILLLSSMNLIHAYEFRPHHLLPALIGALLWLIIIMPPQQQIMSRWRLTASLSFVIGLGAINGIQVHAVGVIYAFVFSTFFALLWLVRIWQRQNGTATFWYQVVPFGIGASLGLALFIMVNLQPVGGIETYLSSIIGGAYRNYSFLPVYLTNVYGIYWQIDIVLMISGWAGGLWLLVTQVLPRFRNIIPTPISNSAPQWQWIIALWALTMFFGLWIDPGYPHVYVVFLAMLGGLFVGGVYPRLSSSFARQWVPIFVVLAVIPNVIIQYNWHNIINFAIGQQPPLYADYAAIADRLEASYFDDEDMLLSADLLFWSLFSYDNWVSIYSGGIYRLVEPDAAQIQQWRDLGINVIAYVDDNSFVTAGHFFGVMDGVLAYMQENDYWVCDEFQVAPYTVSIYRPQADLASHYCPNPERIYEDAN